MKIVKNKTLINKFKKISQYFAIFGYFPKEEEVYTFFPSKISKKTLKILYEAKKNTVGEYSKSKINSQENRRLISLRKLNSNRFRAYIRLISLFSQIQLVGLSGSISMLNANKSDDIDLFIISSKNRLFTARFICLLLAQILGLRRKRGDKGVKDRVCLNLFFDERSLNIPRFKQSVFVGHEVLQMKPIINKNGVYEKFLEANKWVLTYFPNAKTLFSSKVLLKIDRNNSKNTLFSFIFNKIETVLKDYQLSMIHKHRTNELITDTQLWFHPKDFIVNIKKAGIDA